MNNESATLPAGIQQKYRGLRHLLAANTELLEMMADIEADLVHVVPGECKFRESVIALLERTLLLIEDLNLLADGRYRDLFGIEGEIEAKIRQYLRKNTAQEPQKISYPLTEVDTYMASEVGGKAANLGDAIQLLPAAVPPGFVITTAAYNLFLQENALHDRIRGLVKDLGLIADPHLLRSRTDAIRSLIQNSPVPARIADAIAEGVLKAAAESGTLWAVRSSAIGEDGRLSYAGQFDSFLNVPAERLPEVYRDVLASRYSDRAVQYRLAAGSAETDIPMAVIFMPMVAARSAGVLYTRDPQDDKANRMLINSVRGLAEQMVQGKAIADMFLASRTVPGVIIEEQLAGEGSPGEGGETASIGPVDVKALVETALLIEKRFGNPQDIEWAIDEAGQLRILQIRELRVAEDHRLSAKSGISAIPLASGGTTIFAGCSVGEAWVLQPGRDLSSIHEAAVLVVDQATPELGVVLPKIAGLIAAHGNPAGHAATLIREFAIPCIFGLTNAAAVIKDGQMLSMDATRRAIYEGILWPDVLERVRMRIRHPIGSQPAGFLSERILALNLVDPQAASFRPKSCRSIHDIVRFVHEKAVEAMFEAGDRHAQRFSRSAKVLKTSVPLNLVVLDLGGGISAGARQKAAIEPEDLTSLPFQGLWRGVTSPGIRWTGRSRISATGFASVVASSLTQSGVTGRGLGTKNYLLVANDYLCLNARLAYHFAMVDAMIGDTAENNFVNFRFRGGGAGADRRSLRAQFLAQVLLRSNFGVNRQGDLVTAWLRRYPRGISEEALCLIGKLMGCARQLDMILNSKADVRQYADKFLQGDFESFA